MDILNLFVSSQQSKNTQQSYKRVIEDFCNFMNISQCEQLYNISTLDIDKWNIKLKETLSDSSRRTKLTIMNSFYSFMVDRGLVLKNPVSPILSKVKVKLKPQTFLTQKEAHETLQTALGNKSPKDIRNYAILCILENIGVRISELINLKISDIQGNKINILGKGNKYRTLFLNNQVLEAINEYLEVRKDSEYDNLFISNQGTPMNRCSMSKMIKRISKECGIEKSISPHSLRRTSALIMYKQSGNNIKIVQTALGHQDSSTTLNRYVIYDNDALQQAMLNVII